MSAPEPQAAATLSPASLNGQVTLAAPVTRSGVGLHSGTSTTVRVQPAAPNSGRYFVRTDLPGAPPIPARVEQVDRTLLSTELRQGEAVVQTVEHLLAALLGLGVDNARIEIDGPEVPLLDGSALEWVQAITTAGLVAQAMPRPLAPSLGEPVWITQGDSFVAAIPAPQLRFTCGIDFPYPAIGQQWYSWQPAADLALTRADFSQAIAPARTFGFAPQIDQLRRQGLIQGGTLENALVCDQDGWLNPPLRFSDEPVRHKLLDWLGDLSLLTPLPIAHFLAYRASHQLHTRLALALANPPAE